MSTETQIHSNKGSRIYYWAENTKAVETERIMKIITVTGYKGGVAKSTTAIHLAAFFHDYGETILVDGDQNRTALSRAKQGKLPFEVADQMYAMKLVKNAEYVIIDTPARPASDDLHDLAKGCDLLILPTTPDVDSLQPMLQTAKDIGEAKYRVLLTIVPPYPSREGETMRQDLEKAGMPVFKQMIRRTSGFQKAAFAGVTVRDVPRMKSAWNDYKEVGKEILEVLK